MIEDKKMLANKTPTPIIIFGIIALMATSCENRDNHKNEVSVPVSSIFLSKNEDTAKTGLDALDLTQFIGKYSESFNLPTMTMYRKKTGEINSVFLIFENEELGSLKKKFIEINAPLNNAKLEDNEFVISVANEPVLVLFTKASVEITHNKSLHRRANDSGYPQIYDLEKKEGYFTYGTMVTMLNKNDYLKLEDGVYKRRR